MYDKVALCFFVWKQSTAVIICSPVPVLKIRKCISVFWSQSDLLLAIVCNKTTLNPLQTFYNRVSSPQKNLLTGTTEHSVVSGWVFDKKSSQVLQPSGVSCNASL